MKYPDIKVLVLDNGQFQSVAQRLARDFGTVFYHVGQEDEMPRIQDAYIGKGFPEIVLVDSRDDERLEDIGLYVCPDLGYGKTQTLLESQGHPVWGSRMGEDMEQDIEGMKRLLERLGLPSGEWASVKGFTALREYVKAHPDVYVKVSRYRANWETLHCETYELAKPDLDQRELDLSGISEEIPFVVCQALHDKIEMAVDAYVIDGQWPSKVIVGVEEKSRAYIGRFMDYALIPTPLRRVNDALAPILKGYGYRGFLSLETMIGKDGEPFVTDPATRQPSPPGELYQEFWSNYSEIIWEGANGRLIDPVAVDGAEWGAEVMIKSDWVDKHWQPISFPPEVERNVKLNEACRNEKGETLCIPQNIGFDQCGGIIGWGKTPDEAIAMCKKVADQVSGPHIHIPIEAFDDLKKKLKEAEAFGIGIG